MYALKACAATDWDLLKVKFFSAFLHGFAQIAKKRCKFR